MSSMLFQDATVRLSLRALDSMNVRLIVLVCVFPWFLSGCSHPEQEDNSVVTVDLLGKVEAFLVAAASETRISTAQHTPWELLHAGIGIGPQGSLQDGPAVLSIVEYFKNGGPYLSQSIYERRHGGVAVRHSQNRSELERHPNQFLAYFGMMGLPLDMPIAVSSPSDATIKDLLDTACLQFDPTDEITFTLIAAAIYLPDDAMWTDDHGRSWTLKDLIALELAADSEMLACGGSHSSYALTLALQKLRGELPISLELELADRLQAKVTEIQKSQLIDGSFPAAVIGISDDLSSQYNDRSSKIYSTGHSLEWILIYLENSELQQDWVKRAISFIASQDPSSERRINAGTWFHALHALRMYQERIEDNDISHAIVQKCQSLAATLKKPVVSTSDECGP